MTELDRIEAVVREAGEIALAGWPGDGHRLDHWEKSPGDPVSAVDLAVDTFLKARLSALHPDAGWLSEETADSTERQARALVWLVDPIDGTRDFIAGRDGWAVSVALVRDGRVEAGVLCAPARQRAAGGELWRAALGAGAWRNGAPLTASRWATLSGARVPAQRLAAEDQDLRMVARPNSIALRMAMVAADEADLVATLRWGYEWDVAAANLIASEAGARVSDAFGRPSVFNKADPRAFGVVCSASPIHAAAIDRLADRAARIAG